MENNTALDIFELYLPKAQWPTILKVSVKYKESSWLRWLGFFNVTWYRKYYIKVTYKNHKVRYFAISSDTKEVIKSHVLTFNFHLTTL